MANRRSLLGQQQLSTKTIFYSIDALLGHGAFAAVYRAKCDELPCAAKILHSIFRGDAAIESLQERFYQECEYLKSIKHPNIVQYLGLCQESATKEPVLLMELMDQSLTHFLESCRAPLSRCVQLGLCHDIALALAHLHSVNIIHRDLSSNNVLLIGAGSRAKVSDFGMSKVIDTSKNRYTTPLTMVPGTVAYMPQEALGENPKYTEKLDCFSFGVLAIQVLTKLFPNPLPRKKEVASDISLTGKVLVPVEETVCRRDHIDMISKTDPLLEIAIECLALIMEGRPSASELCRRVEELKNATKAVSYSQSSVDSVSCGVSDGQKGLEDEIATLKQELQDEKSRNSNEPCQKCVELLAHKDDLEQRVEYLSNQASHKNETIQTGELTIKHWRVGFQAPSIVARSSSAAISNSAYFCIDFLVQRYDITTNKWNELPKLSSNDSFGIVVVYHALIGKLLAVSNKTLYMVHDGEWVRQGILEFIPWAILHHENYILLFGTEGQLTIMQFSRGDGYIRSSLRVSPSFASGSARICNGAVYVVGASNKQLWLNQVYKLPLDELLPTSLIPKTTPWFSLSFSRKVKTFREIAPLPSTRSTCVSFNDRLFAVGGFINKQASGDIHLYDEEHNDWLKIGRIPTPRYNCLAEIIGDQLVVVGGWLNHFSKCDLVEIATFN